MDELVQFVSPKARHDVRLQACETILGLTGSSEGIALMVPFAKQLAHNLSLLVSDFSSVSQNNKAADSKDHPSLLALVNLSASKVVTINDFSDSFLRSMLYENGKNSDNAIALLVNITSLAHIPGSHDSKNEVASTTTSSSNQAELIRLTNCGGGAKRVVVYLSNEEKLLKQPHVSSLLRNISTWDEGIKAITSSDINCLDMILKTIVDITIEKDDKRRMHAIESGILMNLIAIIRNLCVSKKNHKILFSAAPIDVVSAMVSPLISESLAKEFRENERKRIPECLINLLNVSPPKNQATTNWSQSLTPQQDDTRAMIVEGLTMLALTRKGRENMRNHIVYPVMRIYHPTEKNEEISNRVFDLVELLLDEETDKEYQGAPDDYETEADNKEDLSRSTDADSIAKTTSQLKNEKEGTAWEID